MSSYLTNCFERFNALMTPGTPSRGVIVAVAALLVLSYLQRLVRKRLAVYFEKQAHKAENSERFLRGYDAVCKVLKGVLVLIAASGSFKLLGLTVGFLSTMLGWSLQVPIRGLAAWVMIILKRPFRLGDRITIAGVTGDVLDIQLNHILLNQVGGTVQGEERSGRGILVPNAILFGESILNYNYFSNEGAETGAAASKFMLDEVLVRVTYGSDHEFAKELCLKAAAQATRELAGETDEAPFTRAEMLAWGILFRVRYKSIPAKRQEVSSRVTELIWEAFRTHADRVRFAYPGQTAGVLRPEGGAPPPMALRAQPA